ncbi:MucR family transcriptional regulator [Sphingomonas naphthae]|uniref:MucR family transcriptional regulator n=1 Tax=Sphingomonas naphthae TaxID=1813468 RepID=A0ABY7TM34_9SPHN|nr:MucR family transcriptional regulator [Sphingomonas naphthae]WCT74298.1 MucR family transcriptional regulator [Sphingomonas naphthae]
MNDELIVLTSDIVSAHVSNNSVAVGDVPTLIAAVHGALQKLGQPAEIEAAKQEPAVSIRTSIKPDYIVCLEDGKKLTMLKRYLRTNYNMSPEDYRAKWNLPADYPMVAPNYAAKRRELAHSIGLGRKRVAAEPEAPVKAARKPRAKKLTGPEALAKVRGEDMLTE